MHMHMRMYVSFICKLSLLRKRSSVFISGPLLSICKMSIVSSIVPYVCCVTSMCCAYLEFGLFELIACYMLFISGYEISTCLTYIYTILVDNYCISFGIYHYCYTCLCHVF
jgi:hypothetical protein